MDVSGWIYSKPVRWLVCLLISRLEVWMVIEQWLARRLICLVSGLSIGRTIWPACYPTNHRLLTPNLVMPLIYYIFMATVLKSEEIFWGVISHPSVYLTTDQPTKDSSSTSNQCFNFCYLGFDLTPFPSG